MQIDEFFLLSSKKKMWFVTMHKDSVNVMEIKDPLIQEYTVSLPCYDPFILYDSKNKLGVINQGQLSPFEATIKITGDPKKLTSINGSKKDIQPQDFYEMKELAKLSKIITKKMEKMKG